MKQALTNFHSHTEFCDAKSTIEEFVVQAIDRGFSHWGVSPHCPLPMLPKAIWTMKEHQIPTYFAEIDRLREKYQGQIKILRGMECDWIDENFNPGAEFFQSLGLDYIIGSVHMLHSPRTGELLNIDCGVDVFEKSVNNHFGGSLQKLVTAYYNETKKMINCGGFTFIGHPDKVSATARMLSKNVMSKDWYIDLIEDFLQLCAQKNILLEINTKSIPYTENFHPDTIWWKRMEELNIPVIINSDTHLLEGMDPGLEEARSLYKGPIITEL